MIELVPKKWYDIFSGELKSYKREESLWSGFLH